MENELSIDIKNYGLKIWAQGKETPYLRPSTVEGLDPQFHSKSIRSING